MSDKPVASFGRGREEQHQEPDEEAGAVLYIGEVRGELRLRPYVDEGDLKALGESIASAVASAVYQGAQAGLEAAGIASPRVEAPEPAEDTQELFDNGSPLPSGMTTATNNTGAPIEVGSAPNPLKRTPDPVDLIGPEQLRNVQGDVGGRRSFGR